MTEVEVPNVVRIEWPEQNNFAMAGLIITQLAYVSFAGYTVWRCRRRWLPVWLGALLIWGTLCKYLICTRCERFGEPCDYCYGGKYAAIFFKEQPGRSLDAAGIISEGASTSVLALLPIAAALRNRRLLFAYVLLLLVAQAVLLEVCCSRCVKYATDPWKEEFCPNHKIARKIFH